MLTCEVTPELVEAWRAVFDECKNKLEPNRKSAQEIVDYIKLKYPVFEVTNKRWRSVVAKNVLMNDYSARKLPAGEKPKPIVFRVEKQGEGERLYETQDEIFAGLGIFVGIDLVSGYLLVEGSSELYDELFAFRGLDEEDIENFYLVAQYVECASRFGETSVGA